MLIDYPEPQRSEILDYLFKPNFGAAIQINKVEVGGEGNSTIGSEPSHMRSPTEENYQRGYEWWLMKESKKRNPDIKLFGLEWSAPGWINPDKKRQSVWTRNNIDYLLKWIKGAKDVHGLTIDYMAGWNESGYDKVWYLDFRKALDERNFGHIKVIAADDIGWAWIPDMVTNSAFATSFQIIGSHYPSGWRLPTFAPVKVPKAAINSGKPIWASEAGSESFDAGAMKLRRRSTTDTSTARLPARSTG